MCVHVYVRERKRERERERERERISMNKDINFVKKNFFLRIYIYIYI